MQPLTPLAPSCRCAHSEFANYDPAVNVAEPCAQVSVKFIATISGELADFDADAFAARVAARVGLPAPSLVNVTATAGSVVATATFTEPSPELAAISSALLSFASPAAAASALNVEVEATQVSYDPSPEALVVPVPAGGWRQGCMAPAADSYDPLANWHDQGLCTFAPRGCMNSTAANFAPGATLPAECVTYTPATSSGCLIPTALNYNSAVAVHESAPAWSNGPGSMDHGHSAWLAAGCPCGHPPLQRPSRLLKAAILRAREEHPSALAAWRLRGRLEAAGPLGGCGAVVRLQRHSGCLPRLSDVAALGCAGVPLWAEATYY